MKIYQFVKYNKDTTPHHFKKYENKSDDLIICFDFEDGIQNIQDRSKTSKLKEHHRKYFTLLAQKLKTKNINIGLRLNPQGTSEFEKDILAIKGMDIYSIIIPKAGNHKSLAASIAALIKNNIQYHEIIPVIESKSGLDNLEQIITHNRIKHIIFGHCDYNLDLNIFPFFHNDSYEYWKWIHAIITITNKYSICFINSTSLSLDNAAFFSAMIDYLNEITNDNFGQVTLNDMHTHLCLNQSTNSTISFNKLLKNRLQLYPSKRFANKLINDFEKGNTGKGLTKTKHRIISYQEYISAKKFLASQTRKLHLVFVGGCFPVQHNILYEDIFLSKVKKNMISSLNIETFIDIIRYEQFNRVMDKIKKLHSTKETEVIIFHIRPEPFLRIVKFYYRFVDNNGKIKHSLNIPFLKIINPEKYDYLILGRRYENTNTLKKSKFHNLLININYFLGEIAGNKSYAIKKYIELVKDLDEFCSINNIKLILLGPNSRSNTKKEPFICKALDSSMKQSTKDIRYINGMDTLYNGKPVLHNNGIHVNERYHKMIAERIEDELNKLLSPQNKAKSPKP